MGDSPRTCSHPRLWALTGGVIDLTIAEMPFHIGDRIASAQTINGTLPGPLIRLREGQEVTLNVTNEGTAVDGRL